MRSFCGEKVPYPKINTDRLDQLSEWLNSDRPIDLEIGAGAGLHAVRRSQGHTDRFLIAIERTHNRYAQLERRLRQNQIENALALQGDAINIVHHLIPDGRLSEIFLLYPNPYPKSKQANLRWHRHTFMRELCKKISPDGTLTLATNLAWYADEAEDFLTRSHKLALIDRGRPKEARTHFELKYLVAGQSCFNLRFRRYESIVPLPNS